MSFWGELKRRNVFKVGAAYLIAGWLILQVASITFPALNLPSWTLTFLTVLLIIGFLIALVFSWAFEMTADGVKRTARETPDEVVETEVALSVAEQASSPVEVVDVKKEPKIIAVLPFADLSPESDQEYFVDGLSEEILNSLAKISDLRVIARTSSFSFKGTNKKVQDIARELGVDHILEGSVRKAGDALRITAQLIRAKDGIHLWSETYDRKFKDIFAIQENIASAVADELKVTLGIGKSFKQLGGTDNVQAYEHYLFAQGRWNRTLSEESDTDEKIVARIKQSMESIDAAIALDPEFALAWALKAIIHEYLSIFGPVNQANTELDTGLRAAKKAIELEPNLATGHYSLGCIQTSRGEFTDAESAYRKTLELTNEVLRFSDPTLGVHYLAVGNFEKANKLLEVLTQNDPLNLEIRGFYFLSFCLLGDLQRAEEEYSRGWALFGDKWSYGTVFKTAFSLEGGYVISRDEISNFNIVFDAAKEHLDSPQEGLVEMHRIYADHDKLSSVLLWNISIWACHFGDPELSMKSMRKAIDLNASNSCWLWLPVMREVRRTPRFKKLAEEIGLVDYWNKFGWPGLCHPTNDGDFVCD